NDADDVTVAYYAASQMLVFTVEKFGMHSVVKALQLWGAGKKTPEVIQTAFGVAPAEYDKGYRNWQKARLSRYENQYLFTLKGKDEGDGKRDVERTPNDPRAHAILALALLHGRKGAEAKKELAAALAIDPNNADAHFVSAKVATQEKEWTDAERH